MSERNVKADAHRQKRVHGAEKYVILMMLLSVFALAVIGFFLFLRVYDQGQELAKLAGQVEELTRQIERYQTGPEEGTESPVIPAGEDFQGDEGEDSKEDGRTTGDKQGESEESPGEETASRNRDINDPDTNDPDMNVPGINVPDTNDQDTEDPDQGAAHKVYLTFDDGPSIYTEEILDILDQYQVKATFFVVGKDTEASRERMKEIVARGHTLGMHSYSHKYSEIYASVKAFSQDFAKLREYIYEVTGVESNVYRFPGGSSNTVSDLDMWEFADYLESQDVRFFDWNISSGDGGSQLLPVETLVENCTKGISGKRTAVVLMHDSADKPTTVEALPAIIETILDMEDVAILPITEETTVVQHIHRDEEEE